jgi:hypothetical protein
MWYSLYLKNQFCRDGKAAIAGKVKVRPGNIAADYMSGGI